MLTLFKQIFTWWNHQTLGTRLHTFFKGKFVGKDENGNKYYESKNGRRWVIYNGEVDSTKIPNEWFSWIHFTKNKIEKVQDQKKFSWQKSHKPNLTGTDKAYHPNKSENEKWVLGSGRGRHGELTSRGGERTLHGLLLRV